MSKFYKEEEYVYRDLAVKMSKDRMASVLYAGFETAAKFTTLWNMNRGQYTRNQNVHNIAHVKVHIHPELIATFEELSGCELELPIQVNVNNYKLR